MPRWQATIHYRGTPYVHHFFDEFTELGRLVEVGPHWDTIEKIEVVRVEGDKTLTVQQAENL